MDTLTKPHAHHWVIAEPQGALSEGVCVRCQARRIFRNAPTEVTVTTRSEREFAA
jgi:hypothetical protein